MSTNEVSLLVDAAVGRAVLEAISFPVSVRVPAALTSGEGDDLGRAEVEVMLGDNGEPSDLGAEFERAITDTAQGLEDRSVDPAPFSSEQLQALKKIASSFKPGTNPRSGPMTTANQEEIRDALSVLVNKKTVSIDIEWVKVDAERPDIALGNPITLSNMVVHVQAKVKACVKVGMNFCVKVTTPRIRLEARKLELALSGRGAQVVAVPAFHDVDFVIKIKIYKWTYDVRIGITSPINAQLRKQGPLVIADMSFLQQSIPYSSKKIRVGGITFPANPAGLDIRSSLVIE